MGDPEQFLAGRRQLFAIAYRMLGSATDADDVVQQACLRWSQYSKPVDSPRSFLATLVVRLCLDQLGSARARRVDYIGPWLPEPLLAGDSGPAEAAELRTRCAWPFLYCWKNSWPRLRTAACGPDP